MDKKQIETYMTEVIMQCKAIGIPVSDSIEPEIYINKRAKSRFAACKMEKGFYEKRYMIEVGEALLKVEDPWIIKNILAHEVLHTCPRCYNHGITWKSYAQKMNEKYQYQIKTTSTYEELGLIAPEKKKNVKYIIVCDKCGNVFYRQKKSKLITNINQYRCKCGGTLQCFCKK